MADVRPQLQLGPHICAGLESVVIDDSQIESKYSEALCDSATIQGACQDA